MSWVRKFCCLIKMFNSLVKLIIQIKTKIGEIGEFAERFVFGVEVDGVAVIVGVGEGHVLNI